LAEPFDTAAKKAAEEYHRTRPPPSRGARRRNPPDSGFQDFNGCPQLDGTADDKRCQKATLPRGITADGLQKKVFEPIRWVVHPYIPQGLTLIAAKPKLGKSWLMLDVAVAVARGTFTMGDKKCVEGDVLYAALEDGERRLKARMEKICVSREPWPDRLTFWFEMPRLEESGLERLREWAQSVPDARLIVIDTFARVRSPRGREESTYEADYRQAGALKAFADQTGVAVIVVHHVRKMEADDPLDAVSGTTGLTGAVDTILVFKREVSGIVLYGRGRDIEELEVAVEFKRDTCRWCVLGEAGEVRMSKERAQIVEALKTEGQPLTPAELSAVTGMRRVAVRRLVTKMARAGELIQPEKAKYALP
jgi:hypothetical protein